MANRHDPKAAEVLFEEVLDRDAKWLLFLSRSILRDHQAAEDVVQETFLRLWQALPSGKVDQECKSWLRTVALNLCLDKRRSDKRSLEEPVDAAFRLTYDGCQASHLERQEKYASLLNALPGQQRASFVLTFLCGMREDEVGNILGCAPESVRKYSQMAKDRIRAHGSQ